jgi:hypothetical protein
MSAGERHHHSASLAGEWLARNNNGAASFLDFSTESGVQDKSYWLPLGHFVL